MAKAASISDRIKRDLANGDFGQPGERFLTVRELADAEEISLRTAQQIFRLLEESQRIAKRGKSYFLKKQDDNKSKTKKPALIGCVVTTLSTPYFSQLVQFLEEAVNKFGASLLVASSEYDFTREKERIGHLIEHGAAGLFLCPWATPEEEDFYKTLSVPYVIIGRKLSRIKADTVTVNNQLAAQSVAAHLVEQGATRFLYIGQKGKLNDERLFGFRAGLLAHNIFLEESDILRTDYKDLEHCESEIEERLAGETKKRGKLGIFCYHDLFAVRTLNAAAKIGLKIPDSALVSGFDNLPITKEIHPSITTVGYPIEAMAATAADTLYARIRFPQKHEGICRYLESSLLPRESTGTKP